MLMHFVCFVCAMGLRGRGGAFSKVELGPAVTEAAKSLKMVGTEMLGLYPERRGA